MKQQIAELTLALQRERADALNLRRRVEEERAEMGNYYKAAIIRELLPAIDNLERALLHVPKDLKDHDYTKGVQGVAKQFEQSFKLLGVQRIKTVGEHFDPHLHEAVHMEDAGGEHEIITVELQPGYKIGDEVIRHAMVKVKKEGK
ncbi:nucleotide exchange factor GrpE [Candidatus Saccharibacteria bacterium]|nr:nucleotide exchange factor GrpE [Candidatus Saccharibacteria bacterium]